MGAGPMFMFPVRMQETLKTLNMLLFSGMTFALKEH